MCIQIIRQAPPAYEPFFTLAMIYDNQGHMEKSWQFELISAHLNLSETEEWAIFCYTKALKYEPTNVRYLWEQSNLYEQIGDHKMALDRYRHILNLLSPSDGERFIQLSRDMAKTYYEANDVTSAINITDEAFSKHQGLVSMEDVNTAAELYISNKPYDKALDVITDFSGIVLERKISERTSEENKGISVKLMVYFVHLNILEPLNPLLTSLVEQNPEDMEDLYLDVAEASLDVGEYNSVSFFALKDTTLQ
ncbi:General transcription factor 3C polypeptide 3 [Plecturocebus cupreus]